MQSLLTTKLVSFFSFFSCFHFNTLCRYFDVPAFDGDLMGRGLLHLSLLK